jgi:hypothetical protein
VGKNIPRIYVASEDRWEKHQSRMIEVEGKITNQPIVILIDSGTNHSYIDPQIVEIFHLKKSNIEISWLFWLAIGTKRRINEIVRSCLIDLNGVNTITYLNIIPLGSYDIPIRMDWLDKHHVLLDFITRQLHVFMEKENKAQ